VGVASWAVVLGIVAFLAGVVFWAWIGWVVLQVRTDLRRIREALERMSPPTTATYGGWSRRKQDRQAEFVARFGEGYAPTPSTPVDEASRHVTEEEEARIRRNIERLDRGFR